MGKGTQNFGRRKGWARWSVPGLPAFCRNPLIPAHFLKEPGIAIAVGLLGPQDVSGLEGLAVLLLGSLNIVLWRAEEEAMRNQVLGCRQSWCRGERGPLPVASPLPLAVLSAAFWLASLRPGKKHCGWMEPGTQPRGDLGKVTSLCRW